MRLALWHLNGGTRGELSLLVAGANAALDGFDYRLAERLARTAIAAGGGLAADQALVEALVGQGQAEQAEVILAGFVLEGVPDATRTALARSRALNLHWALGRPAEAEAVLTATEATITDPVCRHELTCLRAKFLQNAGWCAEAADLAREVLTRSDANGATVSDSLVVLTQSLTALGRYNESIAVSQRGVGSEGRHGGSWSLAKFELLTGRCGAYLWAGRLAEAEELAISGYQRSVTTHWPFGTAVWALALGEIGRARGELTAALRWFREAAALVRSDDFRHPYRAFLGRMVLSCYARAAAQAGEVTEAEEALAGADALAGPSTAVMDAFFGPIHAWMAVARGEITSGIEMALKTADVERYRDNAGFEIIALHDVVRLGAPTRVVDRLNELATVVEGQLAALYAAHAAALAANDGTKLDAIAAAFAKLGYNLLAAEAAIQAATAHQSAGYRARAGASSARARKLRARCDGARTPTLITLAPAGSLTRREAEIAQLAATGLSSRVIARRLVVSVRTVDNTLGAVYTKLGLAGRNELAAALSTSTAVPEMHE